jgi:transcriptional regulator with XRE-family HTH domain
MKSCEAVVIRLERLCFKKGININQLAYIAGVSPSTIKSIMNGDSKNPGIVTITKICDGLNITVYEFFGDSIFKELEQEIE